MSRPVRFSALLGVLVALLMVGLPLSLSSASATPPPNWWEPTNRPVPDSQINVTGEPFKGVDANGDVDGFLEAHNHLFSNEAFGGRMICGKVFDAAGGIGSALKDCPEHYPNGLGALFEHVTGGDNGTHDPVGYPTDRKSVV